MNQEQFNALIPIISADIIKLIVQKRDVSEKEATKLLYTSKLYETLEKEDTKLWHYSTHMLYSLLKQEWDTGIINYPDV